MHSINPYAPSTQAATSIPQGGPEDADDVVAIRSHFLKHEASVKSIGSLYLIGATVGFCYGTAAAGFAVFEVISALNPERLFAGQVTIAISAILVGLSTFQGVVGLGLRRLTPWCRSAALIFAVFGLMVIPIGTVISILILYLLLSKKGAYIFSPSYAAVIAATPQIRYRTSIVVWIFLALLAALVVIGVLSFFLGSPR